MDDPLNEERKSDLEDDHVNDEEYQYHFDDVEGGNEIDNYDDS
jgi:hypothetical protein